MKQYWSEGELVEFWTLTDVDRQVSDQRTPRGRFGLAVLLKFFQFEGRFPSYHKEVPLPAVDDVAGPLAVPAIPWFDYPVKGRSGSRDREQLRTSLGFRQATSADAEHIQCWLSQEVVPQDQDPRPLKSVVLDWCRERGIEPPTSDRIDRVIATAVRAFETDFFAAMHRQLSRSTQERLDALLMSSSPNEPTREPEGLSDLATLRQLKADPGRVGLASVLKEIAQLERINDAQLPGHVFGEVPQKILERYRLRVSPESIDQLRRHPDPMRSMLLAAFWWQRRRAIMDGLVDLLMQIVPRVSVNAERKVVTEITGGREKVHGKTLLVFRLAEAAVDQPHGVVSEVLFPGVDEQTLHDLVKAYRSTGPTYQRHVHTVLRSSYRHHYRRMLPWLLATLTFRSHNVAHQPVIDALAWLQAHRDSRQQFVSCDEVPIDGVVRPHMQDSLLEQTSNGAERSNRITYEICVLQALRDRLRCKEIWVEEADRFRNPDDDLPSDFNAKRTDYYAALKQPMDAERCIDDLQPTMGQALTQCDANLPSNPNKPRHDLRCTSASLS
jgi:hypothetical protein